jgi:integrase
MPNLHLTKTAVESLPNSEARVAFYRDTRLPGFGLRISGATKAFFVEKRVNGRTVRVTLGRYPHLTPDLARNRAQVVLGQMALGVDPIATKRATRAAAVTLREALSEYLAARKSLKPRTRSEYERECRIAFGDWLDRPLAVISRDAVTQRHARHGAEHGKAAANRAFRVLRAICNFARARFEGLDGAPLLPANPVERLTQTRAWFKEVRRQTIVNAEQLPAWFEAVEALGERADNGSVVRDYLLVLLFTGLRREEAARLRWSDIDLKARTLTIPDTKNGKPHTLPLAPYVSELLIRRRSLGILPFVFPGDGQTGHLIETRRHLKRVRASSCVYFTLHDLRRTFATIAAGIVPAYALKALLNHRSGGDVTAGYVVASAEHLRGHADRVAERILALAGKDSCGNAGTGA